MKRPEKEEALRWFIHAKDEFYLAFFHFQESAEKLLKLIYS